MVIGNYLGTVLAVHHKIIIYLFMTLTLIFVGTYFLLLFVCFKLYLRPHSNINPRKTNLYPY